MGTVDLPFLDEPLQLTPRQCGDLRRQVLVEPRAAVLSLHLKHITLRRHARGPQGWAVRKESSNNSPTPMQMLLSATLNAGQ